tara:strand:+ start:65 stop:2014 length:1950 start_codon:yes stop_codon:yes gene_type:complete
MTGKKKILFHSDFSLIKTGFGRNAKALLTYLYKTGKYDIVHFCCGMPYKASDFEKTPWKSVGALPMSSAERQKLKSDPSIERAANYGSYLIDKVVHEEKPDIYIGCQDIWGVDFAIDKHWFNKIPSVIWTTLDSLPILPSAVKAADKIKNYWIWSDFATKEFHNLGHAHPITVRGAIDSHYFRRLDDTKRKDLRERFGISENFIVGFVFRNQLRKSVPNLLEGFKSFQLAMPDSKAKLLLHTNFSEGWKIMSLAKEYKIDEQDILTTYVCKSCLSYEVKPFSKQGLNCKACGTKNSQNTVNVGVGVDESQLNEVYNLMDVYCHPFTSGGQEIPIQEAKLTELVTLVTNYSCGEDSCDKEAGSIPLDWFEYREHQTEFKKASTDPDSISNGLKQVFNMSPQDRERMGKKARKWVLLNFDTSVIGKKIEKFVDSQPENTYDFDDIDDILEDPNYQLSSSDLSDSDWLIEMYHNILKMRNVDENDEGHQYWMNQISSASQPRSDIESFFRRTAKEKRDSKAKLLGKEDSLVKKIKEQLADDDGRRIGFIMPEDISGLYLCTSLFRSISELYSDCNLYVFCHPDYAPMIQANPYVFKGVLFSSQELNNVHALEGFGPCEKLFEVVYHPSLQAKHISNYHHNGNKDKTQFNYSY